jgi:hypothetical protein
MEIVVMKIERKESSSMVTGVIGTGVGPLAGDGLDEAFGLAIGLGTIGSRETVFDAELPAGGGEEFGAIGRAAVGEEALDGDAMVGVKGDGLAEGIEGTGDFLVGTEAGESEAGVVVDGDVEGLDAGARIAVGAIAGGADARALEAAQLLDVEVEKVAGRGVFVADDGRFWRLQSREAMETVAAQDAGEGGLGDGQDHEDLSIGPTLAAQGEDAGFEFGTGLARLAMRDRGAVFQATGEAGRNGSSQPASDGFFSDRVGGGDGSPGRAEGEQFRGHLGSHQRGESGISVHVVRAGGRWVECSSTTSLHDPFRADNVLKHDT